MSHMPRQDIEEKEKDLDWCKSMMDYAITEFDAMKANRTRISRLRQSYNGVIDKKRITYLTRTYGKLIKTKFIDYRLGRPKIDLVNGEWLKRNLNSTVRSENKSAKTKKMKKFFRSLAVRETQGEIRKLKEIVGFDGYDGMEIPSDENQKKNPINIRLKNETFMQYALKDQIRKRDLKTKLSTNFKDLEITSECHGIIEIKANGMVDYNVIDPEDAIYVESKGDPFLHKSPIKGHRRWMFVHDILNEYSGEPEFQGAKGKELRDKLEMIKGNPSSTIDGSQGSRSYYSTLGNELSVEVFRIEWISSRPVYTKVFPNGRKISIEPEFYEKKSNRKKIDNDVKNDKYKLIKEWKMEPWETERIGPDIHVRCRRKRNQLRSVDAPHDPWRSYVNLLFNTENGIRVSLQELMDEISFLYNVVMFQINRELSKAKGKIIAYDLAGLPKGMDVRDIMHDMTNDGVYYYNTAGEGNTIGRDVIVSGTLREIDLGISRTIEILIPLKLDLQNMADQMTGISQDRAGQITASSTVTNAQSNIVASRTITEPMFYYMERFTEEVFRKYLESLKVAWGIMESDEADLIVGDEGKAFFKASKDVSNDDYGAYLIDGQRELEIRSKLDNAASISLNAKEIRLPDWLSSQMADTLGEAEIILRNGWEEVEKVRLKSAELRAKSNSEKIQSIEKSAIEDREDRQQHEKEKIILTKSLEGMAQADTGRGQLLRDANKAEQERGGEQERR